MGRLVLEVVFLALLSYQTWAAGSPSPITITGTVRDFTSSFVDMAINTRAADYNIPMNTYDSNGKPRYNSSANHATINGYYSFWQWYRSLPGINYPLAYPITLTPSGSTFTYTNTSFYPIDGKGFGNQGSSHNYYFTYQIQSVFLYGGYEYITITSINDCWVFVNGILALDLGGTHGALTSTVLFNQTKNLGITSGNVYSLDIYFAQRVTKYGSELEITTNAQLICPATDWAGVCLGDGQANCSGSCSANASACQIPWCNATTGSCGTQPTICVPTSAPCVEVSCSESGGGVCVYPPSVCDDGNLCTVDTCNLTAGCQHIPVDCNDFNSCTQDSCDPVIGCINTEINCDDGNPCTLDGCDYLVGCTHTLQSCYDGNACTADICVGQSNQTSYNGFVAGSLVIAMDSNLQTTSNGIFNPRAYGLAAWLLWANVWMDWAILAQKPKDGVDFSAPAVEVIPTAGSGSQNFSFLGGPLVINPKFTSTVYQVASQFNSLGAPVKIYKLLENVPFNVQPKNRIQHKPYVAVLNSGNYWPILAGYLDQAGFIRYVHYNITNREIAENVNASFCFTFASEPHFDSSSLGLNVSTTNLWPINMMIFVRSGGNFLAECEGMASYENGYGGYASNPPGGGFMLTTGGININNTQSTQIAYGNTDSFYMQYDGNIDPTAPGVITDFQLSDGSYWLYNTQMAVQNTAFSPTRYIAVFGHIYPARVGSWIHYLGGHQYFNTSATQMNGMRMYLNAAIAPAFRAQYCPQLGICATSYCTPDTITCAHPPLNCTDADVCTIDSCNVFSGCVHQQVNCNDDNACTNDSCVNALGGCQHVNITCDDGDACTRDTCDPATGCTFEQINCDDNNPCTQDSCNNTVGCVYVNISCGACDSVVCPFDDACYPAQCNASNGACYNYNVTCNDGNPCTTDLCHNTSAGPVCKFTPTNCNDYDPCTYDSCSQADGKCYHANVTCDDSNPCTVDFCVAVNATYSYCDFQPIGCNVTDACFPAYCNTTTGNCDVAPIVCSDGNLCTYDTCVSTNASFYQCEFPQVQCNQTGNACYPTFCQASTGDCVVIPYTCNDGSNCTTDSCADVSGVATCVATEVPCNGSDLCSVYGCYASTGCYVNSTDPAVFCNDNNLCTVDMCNSTIGCYHVPIVLPSVDACHKVYCDPTQGVLTVPNTCGLAGSCSCDPVAGCQCATPATNTAVVVGASIGAGVVAAIIVAIVVFLIIGAIAGKKGYDALKKRAQKTDMVNANPMYQDRGTSGVNPMFEHAND